MSFTASQTIFQGLKIVVAMEENHLMPAVEDINVELGFVQTRLVESEKFYGVPFRNKQKEFCVVEDTKSFLDEFYFGDGSRPYHFYRIRPLYRLVIEPLLDELSTLSHDEILDHAAAAIEQLQEQALVYRAVNKMDYREAYAAYQNMASAHLREKTVKIAVDGIMKLRRKSLALFKQMGHGKEVFA